MTTRASSGHGTLAQRVAGRRPVTPLPAHVVVAQDGQEHPGILVEWIGRDGTWVGRAVWADREGMVHVGVLPSGSIRRP